MTEAAGRARREREVLAAPSACSGAGEADGTGEWDEWYRGDCDSRSLWQQLAESPYEKMRRAFLAGWQARDAAERRKAADELTALTEELGLYDEGREQ